jgi:hypothetical protein
VRALLNSVLQSVGEEKTFLQQAAASGREGSWTRPPRRSQSPCRPLFVTSTRLVPCRAFFTRASAACAEPRVVYTGHQQHAPPLAMRDVAVLVAEERVEYRHPRLIARRASWYARMYMRTHAAVLTPRPADLALRVLHAALRARRLGVALDASDPLDLPGRVEFDRVLDVVQLHHRARRRGRLDDGVHIWVAEECFPGFQLSTSTSTI